MGRFVLSLCDFTGNGVKPWAEAGRLTCQYLGYLQVIVGEVAHGGSEASKRSSDRDWGGRSAEVSLSVRARVASARQEREAARLPEVQESELGPAESEPGGRRVASACVSPLSPHRRRPPHS